MIENAERHEDVGKTLGAELAKSSEGGVLYQSFCVVGAVEFFPFLSDESRRLKL